VTESATPKGPATRNGAAVESGAGWLARMRQAPLKGGFLGLALLLAAYLGSVALVGDDRPLLRPDAPFGLDVVFRMNLVMATITAYTLAVGLVEFRTAPEDLVRLRGVLDCDDATFRAAAEAFFPTKLQVVLAVAAGALVALVMNAASAAVLVQLGDEPLQDLHEYWNMALLVLLFSLLGLLGLWGARIGGLYSSLSRRYARVSLLDPEPLRLFAARGLRLSLFWFVGSGIALLLVVGARAQGVVFAGIALTTAVGAASLLLPSLGIHQRMREVKAAELARVRGEIENRVGALRDGSAEGAAELPALLAWEARVQQVPVWPLGGGTLLRFGLLVLIPLGSWLGGALVERVVDAALG
jgi:hypothetical protein